MPTLFLSVTETWKRLSYAGYVDKLHHLKHGWHIPDVFHHIETHPSHWNIPGICKAQGFPSTKAWSFRNVCIQIPPLLFKCLPPTLENPSPYSPILSPKVPTVSPTHDPALYRWPLVTFPSMSYLASASNLWSICHIIQKLSPDTRREYPCQNHLELYKKIYAVSSIIPMICWLIERKGQRPVFHEVPHKL